MARLLLPPRQILAISIFSGLFTTSLHSQPVLAFTTVINSGLSAPMQLVNAGDGSNRLFFPEKGGDIKVFDQSYNSLGTFLTETVSTGGEQGLLSMVFHPLYASNGYFFVYYTNPAGDLELARYHVSSNPNIADASSKVVLLTIPHPGQTNHNGGELHFGVDGNLYLSTGDGGGAGDLPGNSQNTGVLLGKLLRITVNTNTSPPYYSIPAGNPFGNEIWSRGLRNPFRWSFDKLTNDIWIGDVGQDLFEEVDYTPAASPAQNYGWHCYEANAPFNTSGCSAPSNYTFPIYDYPNDPAGPSAVTGGRVYRGTVYPGLQGYYLATDFYSGNFLKIKPNGSGGWNVFTQNIGTNIVDVGEAENGELFAVSLTIGTVSAITVSNTLPVQLVEFTGTQSNNNVLLKWKTASEQDLSKFEIEYSLDGRNYLHAATIPAQNIPGGAVYQYLHSPPNASRIYYRLRSVDIDGSYKHSGIIVVKIDQARVKIVYPSVVTNGVIKLHLNQRFQIFELIGMNGDAIIKKDISGSSGDIEIPVNRVASGYYIVRMKTAGDIITQRILIK